jgi:heparin binding hemagglutinin HbhA
VIIMAVTLPTAADVRKVREQAAKNAAERAEFATKPLLAVLGAGDRAVAGVTKFATEARTRAEKQADVVQQRVLDLPAELDGLRAKLNADEVRKVVETVREQATAYYAELAGQGEATWGRIRKQPQVEQALTVIGEYGDKLDSRVDDLVDDAHDAAEKALSTVTRQTRSVGEKVARGVDEASEDVAEAVAEVGKDAAAAIDEAGDDAAHATRSTTRRAANRTAPAKPATRKPAAPRTTKTTPKTS